VASKPRRCDCDEVAIGFNGPTAYQRRAVAGKGEVGGGMMAEKQKRRGKRSNRVAVQGTGRRLGPKAWLKRYDPDGKRPNEELRLKRLSQGYKMEAW
jgi:hypothetical protein